MSGRHAKLINSNLDLPELPPVHDTTLGFTALDYGNVALESVRQGSDADTEHMNHLFNELGAIRLRLKDLTPPQKAIADGYLKQYFDSGPAKTQTSLTEWLSDEKGASDSALFDFLQRHAEEVAFQQHSEETQLMLKELKAGYMDKVTAAHADGWLSGDMLHTLDQVESAEIVIGDVWDTLILGAEAYYTPDKRQKFVVVGQALNVSDPHQDLQKKLDVAAWHELIHLHLGRRAGSRWFTEAGTEHINQSLQFGQFDIIDPRSRQNNGGKYYRPERQLLVALTHLGSRPVNPRLVTRAFSSASEDTEEWQEFSYALDQSWGTKNMLEHTNQKVTLNEFHLRLQDSKHVANERVMGRPAYAKPENLIHTEAVRQMISEVEGKRLDTIQQKKPQRVGAAAMTRVRVQL